MTLAYPAQLPASPRDHLLYLCNVILMDGCPPDPCFYYCTLGEDDVEDCCQQCWMNYLHYIASLGHCNPYRMDRQREQ